MTAGDSPSRKGPNFAELLQVEEGVLAAQLRAIRSSLTHPGEKGRGLEHHALRLLRRFLPNEYGLATGFIACAHRTEERASVQLSPQTDVIIYDAIRGAPIVDLGSSHVLPIECVYAAVEVKASLYNSVHEIYAWSSAVRQLRTRHYLVNPERMINLRAEWDNQAESLDSMGGGTTFLRGIRRAAMREIDPPPHELSTESWMPIRCFVLAFEYDTDRRFDLPAACARLESAFEAPGHLDAVLIPDEGVLWNESGAEADGKPARVTGTESAALATFRHRLLDALANFHRPTEGTTMDLRYYFGGPSS